VTGIARPGMQTGNSGNGWAMIALLTGEMMSPCLMNPLKTKGYLSFLISLFLFLDFAFTFKRCSLLSNEFQLPQRVFIILDGNRLLWIFPSLS
jgi:hypothetical protein